MRGQCGAHFGNKGNNIPVQARIRIKVTAGKTASRSAEDFFSRKDFFLIEADQVPIAVDALQPLLDKMIEEQKGKVSMDYIHGSEELFRLATKQNSSEPKGNAAGILLRPFRKQGLFQTIAKRGPLPRKSFSMGDACEKRFYLECRRLFQKKP
ncbi:MAG: hypothetical protein FWG29_08225 [Treponema sp.]|nr:hypothetical protein [Treponema sp.]